MNVTLLLWLTKKYLHGVCLTLSYLVSPLLWTSWPRDKMFVIYEITCQHNKLDFQFQYKCSTDFLTKNESILQNILSFEFTWLLNGIKKTCMSFCGACVMVVETSWAWKSCPVLDCRCSLVISHYCCKIRIIGNCYCRSTLINIEWHKKEHAHDLRCMCFTQRNIARYKKMHQRVIDYCESIIGAKSEFI